MASQADASGWSPQAMVERLGGDDELARQLVALFLAECPRMMDDIRRSVADGQAEAVRQAAHAFKGSVANFADDGVVRTAQQLEHAGRDNRLTDATSLMGRLEGEVASLVSHMRRYEEEPPCVS